jgi:hypothetical protein
MEKIFFDEKTYIWKTKLNLKHYKNVLLSEVNKIIEDNTNQNVNDSYVYKKELKDNLNFNGIIKIEQELDRILQHGIDCCKTIYGENFNKINTDSWVNRVRSKNPTQTNFNQNNEIIFHNHSEVNKLFNVDYTYVYYIQMPNNLNNSDGVLYIKGLDGKICEILPEEDDLIIMKGDLPHVPASAYNSTIDRIVLAGNVGFDFVKKNKTII